MAPAGHWNHPQCRTRGHDAGCDSVVMPAIFVTPAVVKTMLAMIATTMTHDDKQVSYDGMLTVLDT